MPAYCCYDICGSTQVNSFSKYAGFTGVRLGWTIVPEGLMYADGSQVKKDYERVMVNGRLLETCC